MVQNRQVATVQVTSYDSEVAQANQTRFAKAVRSYNTNGFSVATAFMEQENIDPRILKGVDPPGLQEKGDPYKGFVIGVDPERESDVFAVKRIEETNELTPAVLSQRWNIGLPKAVKTLDVTTQAGVRHVYAPGERKLRYHVLDLKFPILRFTWYTDTMFTQFK